MKYAYAVPTIVAGAALAVALTASPFGVFVVAIGLVASRRALRGLPDAERQWLGAFLLLAIALRLAVFSLTFVRNIPYHHDQWLGALTGDEAYGLSRALRARDILLGGPTNGFDWFTVNDQYGANSYITLLTIVQVVFGPTPYSMRLLNLVLFVAGAVLLFRLSRSAYGSLPAFVAMAAVLFLPSLSTWSVSLLKESLYFFATAVFLASASRALRLEPRRAAAAGAVTAVAALVVMNGVRSGALTLALVGLALAVSALVVFGRPKLFVPIVGLATLAMLVALARPAVQQRALGAIEAAAKIHTGHVFTVGHAYKVLDDGFYYHAQTPSFSTLTLTPAEAARFVVRALVSFVVTPAPWQSASARELAYVPEQLVWYALVLVLPIGAVAGWRRDRFVTAVLLGYLVPTALALAFTNGNVGTLVRLRGMVVVIGVWVGAVGLCAALDRVIAWSAHDADPAFPLPQETAS